MPQNLRSPNASSLVLQFKSEAGKATLVSEKSSEPERITIKNPTENPNPCSKSIIPVVSKTAEINTEKNVPKL